MRRSDPRKWLDRRLFLASSAAALTLRPSGGSAQTTPASESRGLSARIAEFVTGFDLKAAPPLAIERARIAFIDTVGVMLAGVRRRRRDRARHGALEGAKPAATVAGSALRTSPQLAALANGVASHALDFDLTYMQGQLIAPLIPALLPLAEANGATHADVLAAYIVGFEVASRLSRANPNHNGGGAWHGTGTIGALARGGRECAASEGEGRSDP